MIIGVAVAAGIVTLATGIVVAVKIERRRNRHFLQSHGLTRGLSKYHRPKLSVNEENYSNISLPTASLRRSVQLPDGIAASPWQDPTSKRHEIEKLSLVRHPISERKKNRRRPLSGHQIRVPKTRRQHKLRKVSVMDQAHQSSLSVITELMDSRSCRSSIMAHPPNEPQTTATERDSDDVKENRTSSQWPLPNAVSSLAGSMSTEVASVAAKESVLMRVRGLSNTGGGSSQRFPAVPRSQSFSSNTSSAPGDPLPPLPTIETYQQSRNLRTRASNISLETVGSSILGNIMSSPLNVDTDLNAPRVGSNAGFSNFDFGLRHKVSTPTLQTPPGRRTIHGLVGGKSSIRSLHPSVDLDGSSHEPPRNHFNPAQCLFSGLPEESLKTIDASTWENPLPLRVNKTRSIEARVRHSMYEPVKILEWRAASDSAMFTTSYRALVTQRPIEKRPASVATTTFAQGQKQGIYAPYRHSLTSLDGPRRGHRRQNCVRITNLPLLDNRIKQKNIAPMPQVEEQQQSSPPSRVVRFERSPPDSLEVSNSEAILQANPPLAAIKISSKSTPSPFRNRPILTPMTQPAHHQFSNAPSSLSSGTPRPDSDVFNSTHVQIIPSSNYANPSPRQWPLSPISPYGIRFNNTPPSIHHPDTEYRPAESPMLPSPAFNLSSLYPRKSLVRGPRNPPSSAYGAYGASPLQHKQGKYYRVSKDRDSSAGNIDLRRSVMMLRSMNSEGRLLDDQSHKIYHDVGGTGSETASIESFKLCTPPVNKRISGLRNSSCTSSIIAVSPNLDGHVRGLGMNAKSNRARPTLGSSMLNSQSLQPSISASPSAISIGGVSIWEDVSVRADSPEPDVPVSRPIHIHSATTTVRKISPMAQRPYATAPPAAVSQAQMRSHHQDYTRQQILLPKRTKTPARVHLHDISDTENSNLVQRLERVVSNGEWDGKRHGSHGLSVPVPVPMPGSEVGLGLRVGDTRLGEPDFDLPSRPVLFT